MDEEIYYCLECGLPSYFEALKDHEVREFVNDLTRAAKAYHNTQQLREVISTIVLDRLKNVREKETT